MNTLKARLTVIAENAFIIPDSSDLNELLGEMLANIGSVDSVLRDDLIYECMATWIMKTGRINPELQHQLLHVIIDDQHMFFRIGEVDTDSVFTRSFSVLLIPLILYAHRQNPFLTKSEILKVKEVLCRYLAEERDFRGFVAEKGWAHAIAHCSDALDELVQCREISKHDLLQILETIFRSIGAQSLPFMHEEDERMATAVLNLLKRQLVKPNEFKNSINDLLSLVLGFERHPANYGYLNAKTFLRSLFFRFYQEEGFGEFSQIVYKAERQINRFNNN